MANLNPEKDFDEIIKIARRRPSMPCPLFFDPDHFSLKKIQKDGNVLTSRDTI